MDCSLSSRILQSDAPRTPKRIQHVDAPVLFLLPTIDLPALPLWLLTPEYDGSVRPPPEPPIPHHSDTRLASRGVLAVSLRHARKILITTPKTCRKKLIYQVFHQRHMSPYRQKQGRGCKSINIHADLESRHADLAPAGDCTYSDSIPESQAGREPDTHTQIGSLTHGVD